VSAALPASSSGSRTEREDLLREALPRWLCEIVSARRCRAASVACALALLALAFPGANRTVTAPRQLYLELLLGPAHRTLELQGARRTALQLALDKCRERVSGADALSIDSKEPGMAKASLFGNVSGSNGVHGGISNIESRATVFKFKTEAMVLGVSNTERKGDLLEVRVRDSMKVEVNGICSRREVGGITASSLCQAAATWGEGRL
jgi:hypothetical protein